MAKHLILSLFTLILLSLATPSFASDVEKCTYGTAALHKQSESAISGVLQKAIDEADQAKAKGDMPACMKALHTAMPLVPKTADKFMACNGGITAMHGAATSSAISGALATHLTKAESSAKAGDLDSCLAEVHEGMTSVPATKTAMDQCTAGRSHLQGAKSISDVIQAAINRSGDQLLDGDMAACNATVSTAMSKM